MIVRRKYAMPYPYTETVVLKGGRGKERPVVLVGDVDAEVPQVSLSDAPVVARFSVSPRTVNAAPSSFLCHEVRYFEGNFYAPASMTESGLFRLYENGLWERNDIPGFTPRDLRSGWGGKLSIMLDERVPGSMSADEMNAVSEKFRKGWHMPVHDPRKVERVVSSNAEITRMAALRLLADLLVVGKGEVWTRIEEPRLLLGRRSGFGDRCLAHVYCGPSDGFGVRALHGVPMQSPVRARMFRLDDRESFESAMRDEGVTWSDAGYTLGHISIDDPYVFRMDQLEDLVERTAGYALSSLSPLIGNQTPDVIAAWLSIRESSSSRGSSGLDAADGIADLEVLVRGFRGGPPEIMDELGGCLAMIYQEAARPSTAAIPKSPKA